MNYGYARVSARFFDWKTNTYTTLEEMTSE